MGSSLLLANKVPPVVFTQKEPWYFGMHHVSLLGLAGCMLSLLVGLRLLWAIGKSGHLDQKVSK
jgi:ubiquinone biosynthesis protein